MELVKGIPITRYCDEQHLTPKERLELFIPICQAVQHAHQKGIIHRDIKPSNILVALYDGQPVPKVIDFGVAKATSQKLTEKTMFTQYGQIVGTLEYMSPEQANLNQLDIDTRSDIYSLGVLLYELLTGATPFDKERLRSAAFEEMMRIIREEEPPRPSLRLSTIDTLPSVAANRRIEPKKLSVLVRGELDWIVMKALEKDRARRYETATGFANDIQRYLNDEPVVACPPSAAYRLKKLVRRNWRSFSVATLLGLALLVTVGAVAGSWGWVARDRTAREARLSQQVDLVLEDLERLTGQQNWPEAVVAAQRAEMLVSSGEVNAETNEQVRQVLAELDLVERLEDIRMLEGRLHEGRILVDLVATDRAYKRAFGEAAIEFEESSVEKAVVRLRSHSRIAIEVAAALTHWASLHLRLKRRTDDTNWRHLLTVADIIDPDPWRNRLRSVLRHKGQDNAALRDLAASAPVQKLPSSNLALLGSELRITGALEEGNEVLRRAQQRFPGDFWINFELGRCLHESNQPEEAVAYLRVALAIRPQDAVVHTNLGVTLMVLAKYEQALACYRRALELAPEYAPAHYALGNALKEQANWGEAIVEYRKAIELDPDYAMAYNNLGAALMAQGDPDKAIVEIRKAIEVGLDDAMFRANLGKAMTAQGNLDEAIAEYRKAIELDPDFAKAYNNLGSALKVQGKVDEAINCYKKAIELDPENANAHGNLGNALKAQGKVDEAINCYEKAIELNPKNANIHIVLGNALAAQGKPDEAITEYLRAIELNPDHAYTHYNLGIVLWEQDRLDEAISEFRKAIELAPDRAPFYTNLGVALMAQERLVEAITEYRKAIELDPDHPIHYFNLGIALMKQGKPGEATAQFRKAIGKSEVRLNDNSYANRLHLANSATNWSWDLATATDESDRDPANAVELANLAIKLQPDNPNHWNNLGVAQYRAANWQAAVDALKKADAMLEEGDRTHRMFLAMAHWKLGDKETAQELFAQGAAWIASHARDNEELSRFRAEAEELMKITEEDRKKLVEEYLARTNETAESSSERSGEEGTEIDGQGKKDADP
jgi:tetratricopeptide (TPR) repeat protein